MAQIVFDYGSGDAVTFTVPSIADAEAARASERSGKPTVIVESDGSTCELRPDVRKAFMVTISDA